MEPVPQHSPRARSATHLTSGRVPFPPLRNAQSQPLHGQDVPGVSNTLSQQQQQSQLPNGPCKYRDLTRGVDTHVCGCRHFWLGDDSLERSHSGGNRHTSQSHAWCFCGHHACYHDWTSNDQPRPLATGLAQTTAGMLETNDGPAHELHTKSAHRQIDVFSPPSQQPSSSAFRSPKMQSPRSSARQGSASGLGLYVGADKTASRSSSRYPSIDFARLIQPNDSMGLPPTRSPSRVISTASSSHTGAQHLRRPSHASVNRATERTHRFPSLEVAMLPYTSPTMDDVARSATEVATPSQSGTPDLDQNHSGNTSSLERHFIQRMEAYEAATTNSVPRRDNHTLAASPALPQARRSGSRIMNQHSEPNAASQSPFPPDGLHSPNTTINALRSEVSSLKAILSSTSLLKETLHGLSQRVDVLESASFTYAGEIDVNERLEIFEGRLLDVENKLEEAEKRWQSPRVSEDWQRSFESQHRLQVAVDGIHKTASLSSNAGLDQATVGRLIEVEKRLQDLENASLPSAANPWNVEVVLIPWGRSLKGIWCSPLESLQAPRQSTSQSMKSRESSLTRGYHSRRDSNQSILDYDEDDAWVESLDGLLHARACASSQGLTGKIHERLKSRGFVRDMVLFDNSARHVYSSIKSTFEDLWEIIGQSSASLTGFAEAARATQPFGLQFDFVPLRKIHKSSQLRYLSRSELSTPSLWTAEFLNSSVFMKAPTVGQRRLFITVPSAYYQSDTGIATEWTWQKIRELPRIFHGHTRATNSYGPTAAQFVIKPDTPEPHWSWDSRIDLLPTVHSSFSSKASFGSQGQPASPQETDCHSGSPSPRSETAERSKRAAKYEQQPEAEARQICIEAPVTPTTPSGQSNTPVPRLHRSTSLPPMENQTVSAALSVSKRLVTSFEQTSSPVKTSIPKRRRLSPTCEENDVVMDNVTAGGANADDRVRQGLTPRWSREPISPQVDFLDDVIDERQVSTRHSTSQVYATPFSHSLPMNDYSLLANSSYGTYEENDTDIDDDDDDYHDDDNDNDVNIGVPETVDMHIGDLFDEDIDDSRSQSDIESASDEGDAWEGVDDDCNDEGEEGQLEVKIKREPDTDRDMTGHGSSYDYESYQNDDSDDDEDDEMES